MTGNRTHATLAGLIAGFVYLAAPLPSSAVSPAHLAGSISGLVTDATGTPQMGATVMLFNWQERLWQKSLTDEKGTFSFIGLAPQFYSIKVTLTTFVPAIRSHIQVLPGVRNFLNVSLANLFSSIQVIYPPAGERVLMKDDWKWVLRTSSDTRPVLRYLPGVNVQDPSQSHHATLFSDTRGLLRLSAGDGPGAAFADGPDLGTSFAVATSLLGNNLLQVAGKVGYGSQSGIPSAAFRTSYSRNTGAGSPEVSVTMRQLFLPGRVGTSILGGDGNAPALKSMSISFDDHAQLAESVSFQYGFSLDSVSFLDRLNYFSPYARLTWSLGDLGKIDFGYTSGNARPDLAGSGTEDELMHEVSSLALFPRVSLRDARARVQRGEDFELSYSRVIGSRTYTVSAYRESVTNAALTIAAPDGVYAGGDILPDLYSDSSIFNVGDYESLGYTAAVTQHLGDYVNATLMYGSIGALTAGRGELQTESPDELRAMIHASRRHAATVRATAHLPWTGTHIIGSYQWTDHRWVMPGHLYSIQSLRPEPGFNLYVRQPIPGFSILPWRMEATADLRNMLAQGYLPLSMTGGRRLLLMQTPRSFRGGLSFIF